MLEAEIRKRHEQRDLLLMTHIVVGYPKLETSLELVEAMVDAGVDLMELQIPFSEPIADGPVILHANQRALETGIRVEQSFEFAEQVAHRFAIPFLFMSYYNVVFKYGVSRFVQRCKACGVRGLIVPDLPPEEASEYLTAMREAELDPIFIFSPNTTDARMHEIARSAGGFVYCVARKGVTGQATDFGAELSGYLARARAATDLPLAVGFGVQSRADVDFLRGKADIAVVGSESLRVLDREGPRAVGAFLKTLR